MFIPEAAITIEILLAWLAAGINRLVKGLLQPAFESTLARDVFDLSRSKTDLIVKAKLGRVLSDF